MSEWLIVLAVLVYFLPSWIAMGRGHHNGLAICVLNLLGGWTFIGWLAALVWALTATPPPGPRSQGPPKPR